MAKTMWNRRRLFLIAAGVVLFDKNMYGDMSSMMVNGFSAVPLHGRGAFTEFPRRSKTGAISLRDSSLFSTASNTMPIDKEKNPGIGRIRAAITKVGMISYIASLCITLPLSMIPPELLRKARIISTTQREILSLRAGQFCARWCLRLIPFAKVNVIPPEDKGTSKEEPSVWVCNHTSMLDVFFLMAADKKLRGRNKRPIKIVYWKQLEANPVTRVLFKMCGFIPIDMAANAPGESNQYDRKSFKVFLKAAKKAFDDGFDIGILPEGQLNPSPEDGLLPVFSGAFTLAKMSRRPIKMMALNGAEKLWHPSKGMKVENNTVTVRGYPGGHKFESADDFTKTFTNVVGYFGAQGKDLDNLTEWLDKDKSLIL